MMNLSSEYRPRPTYMPFEGELSKLFARLSTCFVDLYLGIRVGMMVGLSCIIYSSKYILL